MNNANGFRLRHHSRPREVQTVLGEWEQLDSGGWVRRVKRWEDDGVNP